HDRPVRTATQTTQALNAALAIGLDGGLDPAENLLMLLTDLPHVDVLLALPREELAEIALRTAAKVKQNGLCHLQDLPSLLFERQGQESRFPNRRRREVEI